MASPPRFISQIRGGANPVPEYVGGGGNVGGALQGAGSGLLGIGFDQLTRQAVQEAQIAGKKSGETAADSGQEPQRASATVAGRAFNQAQEQAFVMRQSRKETIENVRAVSGFQLAAQREMERMQSEGDITRADSGNEFAAFLESKQNEVLSSSELSDFGKLQLQQQLEVYRMNFASQFGNTVSSEQQKMIDESATAGIQRVTAQALRDPGNLVSHFNDLDNMIDTLAPGMTPDQEIKYRDYGRQQAIKSSVTGLLANGRVNDARRLIEDTPGLLETMDPDEQRVILGGILAAEKAANAPVSAGKPMFQDMPIEGGQIQRVVSYDNGQTWRPFGTSYDRREPFIIQDVIGDDGTIRQVAIPRDQVSQAMAGAQSQPAGDQGAAVEGLPPGAVVLSETPTPASSEQAKVEGYSDRAAYAQGVLSKVEDEGVSLIGGVAENFGVLGNALKSDDRQKYEQAKRLFISAVLRRDSGANIPEDEFRSAELEYFPQPFDGPDIIKQKREAREVAAQALKNATSQAYQAKQQKKTGTAAAAASTTGGDQGEKPGSAPKRIRIDLDGNVIDGP